MRCNFEKLCLYLKNELDESRRFEVLAHLHQCDICMEAVILMSAEQDAECPKSESPGRWIGHKETHGKRAASPY